MKILSATTLAWLALGAVASAQPSVSQHSEAVNEEAPDEDTTVWSVSAGGSLSTGNTESVQLNAGSDLQLVRGNHGLEATVSFLFGMTPDDNDELDESANNLQARARYDLFFTDNDAAFLAAAFRRDTFAALDSRIQGQIGYLRNLFKEDKHRFWTEIGYDLTLDNFHPDPLLDDMGNELDGDDVLHSARLFAGYDNQLNEAVSLLLGIEGLLNLDNTDDLRVNGNATVRSSVSDNLKLEVKFTALFDNDPVADTKRLDTITLLNLVYSLI